MATCVFGLGSTGRVILPARRGCPAQADARNKSAALPKAARTGTFYWRPSVCQQPQPDGKPAQAAFGCAPFAFGGSLSSVHRTCPNCTESQKKPIFRVSSQIMSVFTAPDSCARVTPY